jgi:predicted nucleic acid-binding protein
VAPPFRSIRDGFSNLARTSSSARRSPSNDVLGAIDVHRLHQVSFWDALLVQAARRAGCATLLTEDLKDGRRFDGLVVRNPFPSLESN